ncbi:YeiH family protein [Prauserella alba]|uniref:Sulfate exporter family transporter n=1 Tax=Prauserella alba TaxID=176898 RepID=A0ABP4GBZ7_9PSEU|nr:putative sulfate exporter family transporter [Prauserella alba]
MTKQESIVDRSARRHALLPGIAVATAGTAAAFGLSRLWPVLSALTVAVVLGVAVGRWIPERARPGLAWATKRFLRVGVVLLGLQLGLGEVLELGPGVVAAVTVTVVVAFFGTLGMGRLLGVSPGLRLLVATGFSICGASAIAAMDSVTESDREDVATGVTLVTLYGSGAIAAVPLLGRWLGMMPEQLGAWAGVSIHEVAQVVAAASPAGAAAVAVAVVVKLTRVVLLAPMVAGVSVANRRRNGTAAASATGKRPPLVPLFVVAFLVMMAVRSTGAVPPILLSVSDVVGTLLFAAALFGLGTGVNLGSLLRTGRRGLALGALSTLLVAVAGYTALAVAGAV